MKVSVILNALTQVLSAIILIHRQADMLSERSQVREGTKSWDRFFTPAIVIVGTLAVLIAAGWMSVLDGVLRPIQIYGSAGNCGAHPFGGSQAPG